MIHTLYNGSRQLENSHCLLVGPPLVAISVFCFGLVLLQPAPQRATTSLPVSRTSPDTADLSASLPRLPTFTDTTPAPVLLQAVDVPAPAPPAAAIPGTASLPATAAAAQAANGASHQLQAAASASQIDPGLLSKLNAGSSKSSDAAKHAKQPVATPHASNH